MPFVPLTLMQPFGRDLPPRWIPVEERLPEELTTVLVYHPAHPFRPCGIDLASQMDGGSWMLSDGRLGKPTHWMPLPAPPEVE